jgi:hypothetical protein
MLHDSEPCGSHRATEVDAGDARQRRVVISRDLCDPSSKESQGISGLQDWREHCPGQKGPHSASAVLSLLGRQDDRQREPEGCCQGNAEDSGFDAEVNKRARLRPVPYSRRQVALLPLSSGIISIRPASLSL